MKKVLILILALVLSFSLFAMVACQQPCETHMDTNHDGICDVCETEGLSVTHTDTNHDGKCDGCGGDTTFEHTDAAHDGQCDVCGKAVEVVHVDANNDGFCDVEACGHKYDWVDALASAKEYVDGLYRGESEATTADYTITTVVAIGGVSYSVEWTITSDVADQTAAVLGEINSTTKQQTVDVDEFSAAEVAYKLVAKISDAAGHSVTAEYARKVPQFNVATWEEYVAACEAKDGETIISVRGYVTAVNADSGSSSKGSLWIRDAEGHGYYAYKPALDSSITASRESILEAFPVGAEVVISGTVSNQYGTGQHQQGCTIIKTGNTAPEGWNVPVDATEAFSNATGSGDLTTLEPYFSSMVTLEGITMGQIDGYNYHFTLNGKDYICYMNIYLMDSEASAETAAKWVVGGKANLTGLVTTYSSKFQVYPYGPDCLEIIKEELTDEQKIERAKSNLTIDANAAEGDAIPLPTEGAEGTTIAWAFAEGQSYDFATLADNTLTITGTPSQTTKLQLVATITSGSESATKAFEVTVEGTKIDWLVTADALEICDALENGATTPDYYYFYGTVGEIYNTQYCNFYLLDKDGNSIIVYGLYAPNGTDRYGSNREIAEIPFQEGDLICLRAKVQKYYKSSDQSITPELVSAVLVETPAKGTEFFVGYSATEALAICDALENGATTPDYAYFMGVVGEIYNTGYCNFYLTDANGGSIIVYGLYAPNGTDRYGSNREIAEIPFKEGDIIYLRAKVQKYYKSSDQSITPELVSAVLVSFYTPAGSDVPAHECESVCPECSKCLDKDCTDAVCANKCEGHEVVEDGAPIAGTYVLEMYQSKKGENYYFTGTMSGYYFATSTNKADAVEIILAKLENGNYTMKLANGKYLAIVASGTHLNAVMQVEVCEWTWNAEIGSFTAQAGSEVAFLGTYGDYSTIGGSKLSYASTSYVAKLVAPAIVPPVEEHKCESVCPECGKCLDTTCTEAACATKCEGHVPPHACESVCPECDKCKNEDCAEAVCADKCEGHTPVVLEDVVVNVGELVEGTDITGATTTDKNSKEVFQLTANSEIKVGSGIFVTTPSATDGSKLVIDGNKKSIDDLSFTKRIKFGGNMQVAEDVVTDALRLEIKGAATITVYAMSSSSSADRNLLLVTLAGNEFTTVGSQVALGASISKQTYTVTAAGTYYLGSENSGINIYYIAISYGAGETPAHECEDVCEECGKCTSECADAACAEKCAGHTAIVVIDGKEYYSEAKAEAALRALAGGEKVAILTNATIAEAHTFVAADYTLGEGATLTIKANVVVPAGTKLTASANATIVVEAGAHIDLSALTRDEFATSTSARLEIAEGAKVTMPAFTEALWNDAYLKVIIEAMIADSEVGAELVLGETELTKEADGWKVPHTCESKCAECGKCLDKACTETACADKCEGHVITTIAGALTAADGTKVELTGTVRAHAGGYKNNFYLVDEDGHEIYVYYANSNVEIGDVVKVAGVMGTFNNARQVAKGSTVTVITVHVCSEWDAATCTEAELCKVCSKVKTGSVALGHKDEDSNSKCDVCTADLDTASGWILVKDASTLAVGDQIVIVAAKYNFALSTTQNNNNRAQAAVEKSGDKVTFGSDVQIITLEAGTKTGTFAFNVGSGKYLYAASSSSNHLKSGTKNDNASWKIEIAAATGVATIKAQGTSTRNWLRYNDSNNPPLFSAYGSGQSDVCIYKLVGSN